jgi:hypothetical protein
MKPQEAVSKKIKRKRTLVMFPKEGKERTYLFIHLGTARLAFSIRSDSISKKKENVC